MDSSSAGNNPFAVLTAVVAPAILTNASSVLALGTSNRLARVVDRTRAVSRELALLARGDRGRQLWLRQLDQLQERTQLLVRALRLFYASLGLFATAALVSVVGALVTSSGRQVLSRVTGAIGLLAGAVAVSGLAFGCLLMVRETRLAVQYLAEEAKTQLESVGADPPGK